MLSFPQHFLWGAATAPQHVEGQNFNSDWSAWEQLPGKIKHGHHSQVACDWWGGDRWREDFDRAQALGMNAQRIGIEWARLEPDQGEWSSEATARYREMILGLRERGMEPFVTMLHFTSPQWVAERGGFENPKISEWMARYAERAAREFGDLVTFWITINEPNAYAYQCYLNGIWLAQKQDLLAMLRVVKHQVRAHAAMYHAIKRIRPDAQVGYSHHWRVFEPHNPKFVLDRLMAAVRTRVINDLIFDAIEYGVLEFPVGLGESIPEARGTQDFLGVNYYYQEYTAFDLSNTKDVFARSVYDPEISRLVPYFGAVGNLHPDALFATLVRLAKFMKPIYITENGLFETDRDDQTPYLVTHLEAVHRAIQAGADVRGYMYWSLLDNFEWSEGYTPRFGLYHSDFETQTRTLKRVGQVYEQIIRSNGIPDDVLNQYGR